MSTSDAADVPARAVLPTEPTVDGRTGGGHPVHDADVAVIGAGVAGLTAAVELGRATHPPPRTIVVDKGEPGGSGSSPWAQGGVAVALGDDDSPRLHAADTIRAGVGLNDPAAVAILTREGPERVRELVALGAELDRTEDGHLHLAREGGQTVARSVHRADATGAELVRALRVATRDRVERLGATALELAADEGRVVGVWVLADDELRLVRASAVLLASGGCGGLFAATTNRTSSTGDGLALAWRAGAALRDLEFVQFHPTGLRPRDADVLGSRPLLTEALRGAGATLQDASGHRFLRGHHPDAELAPRHVVTRAMLAAEGGAWLDATPIGADELRASFPTAVAGAERHGYDLTAEPVPVEPVAHYQVGGVRTDHQGRTSVPGLWAAGEVASTGVHGANRMAGNSLLESSVFAVRAARSITARAGPRPGADPPAPQLTGPRPADPAALRRRLRTRMWAGCGPVRDARRLAEAGAEIAEIAGELGGPSSDPAHLELIHAVTAAGLLVRAAAIRTESRGCHLRADHPERATAWDDAHVELIRTT